VASPEGQGVRIFSETADPSCYVARSETERALAQIYERIVDERGSAWLSAPPGIGKSLMLRVLAERLSPAWRCVYLPYAALDLRDLCRWVIGRLGLEPRRPIAQQLATVAREHWAEGSALVLLIDDANTMPPDTARALGHRVRRLGGALRLVLASAEDARASRVRAALGLQLTDVNLVSPLSANETRDYIETRLRVAGAGLELRDRFDGASIARIHRMAAGVPRRIHDLAFDVEGGRPLVEEPVDPVVTEGYDFTSADEPELAQLGEPIAEGVAEAHDLPPEVVLGAVQVAEAIEIPTASVSDEPPAADAEERPPEAEPESEAGQAPLEDQALDEAPGLPVEDEAVSEALDVPPEEEPSTTADEAPPAEEASAEAEDAPGAEETSTEVEETTPAEELSTEAEEPAPVEEPSTEAEDAPAAEDASTGIEETAHAEEASTEAEGAPPAEKPSTKAEEAPPAEVPQAEAQDAPPAKEPVREPLRIPSVEEPLVGLSTVPLTAETAADHDLPSADILPSEEPRADWDIDPAEVDLETPAAESEEEEEEELAPWTQLRRRLRER